MPWLERAARYGGAHVALVDGDERVLTYDEIIRAALRAWAMPLKRGTQAAANASA